MWEQLVESFRAYAFMTPVFRSLLSAEIVVEIKIGTSKSESMVFREKRVECPLRVEEAVLPHVEEFKYFVALFMTYGRMERD